MNTKDIVSIVLALAVTVVIVGYSFKGAQAHRLQVDCADQSGQDCVLYAIPLRKE